MNILRPLSPHLPIYKPQLTSTFPISHRISGASLTTIVLCFSLNCMKIGLICFTSKNFYQFLFYSKKLILISVAITALALSYHLYNGLCHLYTSKSSREVKNINSVVRQRVFRFIGQHIRRFLIGGTLFLFFVLICHRFETMLSKAGFSLVSRALSFILIKVGLSGCMVIAIEFAVKAFLTAEGATTINHMQPAGESSGSEAHSEPSADSSSAPSALDQRKDELIQANLLQRKGHLAEGQEVAEVRQAVETDFGIDTKGAEFELIRQMEKEVGSSKNEECPATNSIFNEIKDHLGKHQDGRGGGKPNDCANREEEKPHE